jgi:hypothetical protein
MKTVFSLLAGFATIGFAQAGGFGGPPPFTNGSPLVQGVDGSYQATARGTNLTGVFRFTYANGRQTSAPTLPTGETIANLVTDPYNDYVFFAEGLTYRGLVQANINTSQIAGVFDNGSANVPVYGGSNDGLGVLAFLNGFFTGKMDQQSPYAAFSGKGEVTVNTSEEIQELVPGTGTSEDNPPVFNTFQVITQAFTRDFKFKGVRAALSTGT